MSGTPDQGADETMTGNRLSEQVTRLIRAVRNRLDPPIPERQHPPFCPCSCGWIVDMCDCPVFCPTCSCRVPDDEVTTR